MLVNQSLPKNYQAVQAGHAVAEYLISFPSSWRNETLIYLRAKDEQDMNRWLGILVDLPNTEVCPFFEPDLNDELTAMAFISNPITDELMKNERLI